MAKRAAKIPDPGPPVAVESPQTLVLAETLDLAAASDCARSLLAVRGSDLTIDASGVRHLGGQCAQVLVSAVRTWSHDRAELQVVGASAEFIAGLRLLGLTSAIESKEAC